MMDMTSPHVRRFIELMVIAQRRKWAADAEREKGDD